MVKNSSMKCTRFFFLVFFCVPLARAFTVHVKNLSGKTLIVWCQTVGQDYLAVAEPTKKGKTLSCNARDTVSWSARDNGDLYFKKLELDHYGEEKITVQFMNADHSEYCTMLFRINVNDIGWAAEAWFNTENLTGRLCTSDHLDRYWINGSSDYATVRIN